MKDEFDAPGDVQSGAAYFRITRRRFLQSSAAVPLSASAVGVASAADTKNSEDERDLQFQYLEGRRKVRITVLFDHPKDKELPFVAGDTPIFWEIDARRFGPQAYFSLRDTTQNEGRKGYELRIRNGRFGALKSANLVFHFDLRKDPTSDKDRFSILAEVDYYRRPTGQFSFFLEDYTNPFRVRANSTFFSRLRSSVRRAPRPAIFRDYITGEGTTAELKQFVGSSAVDPTFEGMFNGLIKYRRGKSGRPEVVVSLLQDMFWSVEPRDVDASSLPYIASVLLPLQSIRYGWMMADQAFAGIAPAKDDPSQYQLHARAVRHSNRRFNLFGGVGPTIWFDQKAASERQTFKEPGVFILRRDDSRADGASRAEASLPGIFDIEISDAEDRENHAGPFRDVAARLLLRADKTLLQQKTDYSLSFDGDFNTTTAHRAETPLGPIVLRGPSLSPETNGSAEDPATRRPRVFVDPFETRWDQGVSIIWSKAETLARELDWLEINVLLLEHSAALNGAQYSRLTFEPTDLRILWAPESLRDDSNNLTSFLRLGPRTLSPGTRINLDRAKLRASRTNDLLSLQFRFANLWLAYGPEGPPELVKTNPACLSSTGNSSAQHDPRAIIVVDFPGQHLFEEAVFLPKPEPLPDVELETARGEIARETGVLTLSEEKPPAVLEQSPSSFIVDLNRAVQVDEALRLLASATQRKTFRQMLSQAKAAADAGFKDFQGKYFAAASKVAKRFKLPEEQWIYIGNLGLDIDARALAHNEQRALKKVKSTEFFDSMIVRVRRAHDDIVAAAQASEANSPEDQSVRNRTRDIASALVHEGLLEQAVPAYQLFRAFYRDTTIAAAIGAAGDSGNDQQGDTSAPNVEMSFSVVLNETPEWLPSGLSFAAWQTRYNGVRSQFISEIIAQSEKEQIARQTRGGLVEGRLANPSRLAFRVNCADWTQVQRARNVTHLDAPEDATAQLPRQTLRFSLGELTNFANFELAVTRRSERVYTADEAGRADRLSRRTLNVSPGAMLDHLGFHQGPFVNSATRLADIQKALQEPPSPFETAIEIPARLVLSPHQDAVVIGRNTGKVPDSIFCDNKRKTPDATALWSADFLIEAEDPGVRAVHSPDLRSDFLWGRQYGKGVIEGTKHTPGAPPPRGPRAPWFSGQGAQQTGLNPQTLIGPGTHSATDLGDTEDPLRQWNYVISPGQKTTLSDKIACFCRDMICDKPADTPTPDQKFRGPTDAFMRHELVLLSSGWGLPVLGRRSPTGSIKNDASQVEPEPRHRLIDLKKGSALYQPRPLEVTELSLSALGGSIRHDSSFEPPASAQSIYGDESLFDALSIERWQQWTVLSRDVFCEVTFKGFLFPLGHRAALVQVTEREFLRAPDCSIRAYLRQRMFIRLGKPEKRFPAISQPFDGRLFPVERLRILTTKTPDIMDPTTGPVPADGDAPVINAQGRLNLKKKSALAFWPRTAPLQEANVRFEMEVDGSKTDLPLMFVDNVAANDSESLKAIVEYYNQETSPDDMSNELVSGNTVDPVIHVRTMLFQGEKRRYAPELKAGSASIETDHWTLAATGLRNGASDGSNDDVLTSGLKVVAPTLNGYDSNPVLQGADQPPFYPAIDVARIRLRQAERLVGKTYGPVRTKFDASYLRTGFPEVSPEEVIEGNAGEVFLNLLGSDQKQQGMGKKGDQSGGVFRPSGYMIALSRAKGVLSNATRVPVPNDRRFAVVSEIFNHTADLPAPSSDGTQIIGGGGVGGGEDASAKATAALNRAREIYSKLFDSDAKILGLVSLKDLMNVLENLQNPNTGMPELNEQIRYGAGQVKEALKDAREELQDAVDEAVDEVTDEIETAVDDIAGEARRQASDAADLVRLQVVKPLADAVRDIRKSWDELEARLAKEQRLFVPDEVGAITIREIFPELDGGLKALDLALTDSANQSDQIAFALSLGAVYEAGRRFIDALQRSLSNPVARIEDAFRSRFDAVRTVFDGVTDGLPGVISTYVNILIAKKSEDLAEEFTNFLFPDDDDDPSQVVITAIRIPDLDIYKDLGIGEDLIETLRAEVSMDRRQAKKFVSDFIIFTLSPDTVKALASGDLKPDQLLKAFLAQDNQGKRLVDEFDDRKDNIRDAIEDILEAFETRLTDLQQQLTNAVAAADAALESAVQEEIDRINAAIGELQILLFTLVTQEADKIREAILREFVDELAVLSAIVQKFEALKRAAATGSPRSIISAALDLLQVFTGPLNISSEDICNEINAATKPLRSALSYLNPEALILSDPTVLGQQVVLDETNITLPQVPGAGRVVARQLTLSNLSKAKKPGDLSRPASRLFVTQQFVHDQIESLAAGYKIAKDELENIDTEEAPQVADDIKAYIDEFDINIRNALTGFKDINDKLATSYVAVVNADRSAVVLRSRLDTLRDLDLCSGDFEAQRDAAARLPRDLEAFADAYQGVVDELVDTMRAVGKAVETLINDGTAYAALFGIALAALDRETGLFKKIETELKVTAKTAKTYAHRLQRFELKLTVRIAGILRDAITPALQQTGPAVELLKDIEALVQRNLPDLVDLKGLKENVEKIEKAVKDLEALQSELTKISAKKIPDYDPDNAADQEPLAEPRLADLQKELESGLSPLNFVSITASVDPESKTLAQLRAIQAEIENDIQTLNAELHAGLQRAETAVLKQADGLIKEALKYNFRISKDTYSLVSFYQTAVTERAKLIKETPEVVAASLRAAIVAPPSVHHKDIAGVYTPADTNDPTVQILQSNDALAGDAAWLNLAANDAPLSNVDQRRFLKAFVNEWLNEESAPFVIGKNVVTVISDILRGDIMRFIDLNAIRAQIEEYLLSLVPSEIQMRYGYGVPLGDPVRKATGGIFAPASGSRLDIRTGIVIRLNRFEPEIDFSSVGTLGAFDVKLVGDAFDALTLRFKGARFETKGGSKPRFDITYDDYIIGEQLEFVQQLQSILSPSEGSGSFIIPRFGLPGIEAGYSLNLGVFSIGAASFFNISLRTSAILPFGDSDARFRASLSTRSDPFTISYLPFGGSGFFAIEANANGIVGFEASFEFGGAAAFGFGPLTGQGRLMAGVYVRQMTLASNRKLTEITGTFYVGGSARIWIFGFGASLYVRLGMVNGDMSGEAIFTYSFSIGLKDFDFSIEVWKQEEKGFNGQSAWNGNFGATRFADLSNPGLHRTINPNTPLVETDVKSPDTSFASYRDQYFKKPLKSEDYF